MPRITGPAPGFGYAPTRPGLLPAQPASTDAPHRGRPPSTDQSGGVSGSTSLVPEREQPTVNSVPATASEPDTGLGLRHPGTGTGSPRPMPLGRTGILVLASVASFMVALDLLVVTTALETIRRDIGASPAALQWTLTAYSLSFAGLLMTGAALGDRFGRRRVLAAGLAVFVLGSAAAALSSSVGELVAARVVQGAGGAVILPLSLAIVSAGFPPERQGAAIGVLEGVTGLAVIAGPVVGGLVVQHLTWQWVFWVNVPIGLVAVPLVLAGVAESRGPDRTLDLPGLALVGAASFSLVWGLVRGNDVGWAGVEILAALAAGVALGAAFVAVERRVAAPMLPTRLFASRSFSAGVSAAFLLSASLYASVFLMAQFLQVGLGHDVLGAGLRLLPWTATLLVVAPVGGLLADRFGPRPVLAGGLALQVVGLAWLALVADAGQPYGTIVVPLVVAGVGCSAAIPVSQAAVVGSVARDDVGKAAGATNMLQELGGAFGVAVGVAVFAAAGSYTSARQFSDGFGAAMAAAAGVAGLGLAAALALPRREAA
jgi:EmrB/QacA subfamily drug resistance transporter